VPVGLSALAAMRSGLTLVTASTTRSCQFGAPPQASHPATPSIAKGTPRPTMVAKRSIASLSTGMISASRGARHGAGAEGRASAPRGGDERAEGRVWGDGGLLMASTPYLGWIRRFNREAGLSQALEVASEQPMVDREEERRLRRELEEGRRRLADLRTDARYHRERRALYNARRYGSRLTSPARMTELHRAAERADERVRHAEREQAALAKALRDATEREGFG
jgi:hypothetical protein